MQFYAVAFSATFRFSILVGLVFWTLTVLGMINYQWRYKGVSPFVFFFYGTMSLFFSTILAVITNDLGYQTVLFAMYSSQALQGATSVDTFFWCILSSVGFGLLCLTVYRYAHIQKYEFWDRVKGALVYVVVMQIMNWFYFEIIK